MWRVRRVLAGGHMNQIQYMKAVGWWADAPLGAQAHRLWPRTSPRLPPPLVACPQLRSCAHLTHLPSRTSHSRTVRSACPAAVATRQQLGCQRTTSTSALWPTSSRSGCVRSLTHSRATRSAPALANQWPVGGGSDTRRQGAAWGVTGDAAGLGAPAAWQRASTRLRLQPVTHCPPVS